MARVLVTQGDGPVGESEENPEGTLLALCAIVAAHWNDDYLFRAIQHARLAQNHPRDQ